MHTRFGSLILALLLIHAAARLAAQEGSILPPAPTPTDVKPGSITCDECPYPYPSKYLDIRVYSQDVRIAYMDVAPQGAANGHTVVLLHGNNFGGFYFKAIIDAPHEGRLPRHRPRPDRLRQVVEADCAVQLQLAGAQHLPDPAEGKDRTGDGGRPLDGRHAGGAAGDAVSEGDRAGGDLQPDRPHRRPLRSADARPSTTRISRRSRPTTRASAPAWPATWLTTRRRGMRSSRPTRGSATRGRSAPTGRGWRWCRR